MDTTTLSMQVCYQILSESDLCSKHNSVEMWDISEVFFRNTFLLGCFEFCIWKDEHSNYISDPFQGSLMVHLRLPRLPKLTCTTG